MDRRPKSHAHRHLSGAAPFEALWSCADLFLTACITLAVSDGPYSVEEARIISLFAHRLGYSVRRLSELEDRVFTTLNEQAHAADAEDDTPTAPRRRPSLHSREDTTVWLRDSDSEMIEHFRKQRRLEQLEQETNHQKNEDTPSQQTDHD